MKELAQKFDSEKIEFIGVNVEGQVTSVAMKKKIEAKLVELALPFATIIDEGLKIFYDFGVIAVPSTAVLEKGGNLRYGPAGYSYTTRDLIKDSIETLLGLRQPSSDSVVSRFYSPNKSSSRYYYLATKLLRERSYERAMKNVARSIAADSLFSAPHCLLGEINLILKKPLEAKLAFEKAISLETSSIVAWNGLGQSLLDAGELDSARSVLNYALELDSTYIPVMLSLSYCLSKLGQHKVALDYLNRALELNEKDPEIHFYLGRASREIGNNVQSVESYLAALKILFPVK
jgi:tetratricopeptide (TPR) repeat protein